MSDTTTERTVAPKHLLALIQDANQKKTKMQSISGELGALIKEAVENGHLNRKAFGLVAQLDRQDEDKRNDNVRSIRLYLDICEEQLWGDGHVGDLVDKAERSDGKPSAVDEQMRVNAERIEAGIKEIEPGAAFGALGTARELTESERANGVLAAFDDGKGLTSTVSVGPRKRGRPRKVAESVPATVEAASKASFDRGTAPEPFEDDAESDRPSIVQNERREALSGADAAGSYSIRH